jgi:hypothetical protein
MRCPAVPIGQVARNRWQLKRFDLVTAFLKGDSPRDCEGQKVSVI